MPRASSRSSSSASASSASALPHELHASPSSPASLLSHSRSVSASDDEPLLRAVVQVALEAPPLGVAGLDDAGA